MEGIIGALKKITRFDLRVNMSSRESLEITTSIAVLVVSIYRVALRAINEIYIIAWRSNFERDKRVEFWVADLSPRFTDRPSAVTLRQK